MMARFAVLLSLLLMWTPGAVVLTAQTGVPAHLAGPHDPRLAWLARYDDASLDRVLLGYPGSGFVLRYTGAAPSIDLSTDTETAALTLVVDDGPPVLAMLHAGRRTVATTAPEAAFADRPHTLTVYKRTETWQGVVSVFGIVSSGDTALLPAPPLSTRRLLFVGDSVTCGAGVARNDRCTNDPAYPNTDAYHSYGMILGRRFDAQTELVCYGGRGVVRDYRGLGIADGVLNAPEFIGLAIPTDDPKQRKSWDERRTAPDLVFVSLGTNDFNLEPKQPLNAEAYVGTLAALLQHLLSAYPKARVVATGGAITTDPLLRTYVERAVERVNDARLTAMLSTHYPGNGCDAHPTAAQHLRMADDIEPEIRSRLHW